MRVPKLGFVFGLFAAFFCSVAATAQAPALSSGDVTVRLTQGLDSSVQRPGQASQGFVSKSTNPGVPTRSAAIVQLVANPAGGFSVQLVRLGINGQVVRTASSGAVLAPDLLGGIRKYTRTPGAPQDAVSGMRVFLPQDTIVRFTLTEPPPAPIPTPATPVRAASRPAAPPPPPAPITGKAGDFPAGPGLPVLHTDRTPYEGCHWSPVVSQRYGFAILAMDCAGKGKESPPHRYSADDPGFINSYDDERKRSTASAGTSTAATIKVFTKPAAQTLDAAVRAQILSTVKAKWRPYCHVQKAPGQSLTSGVELYAFTGTSGPALQIYKKADVGDTLPCDPWEDNDSANDFIYIPAQSKTTFFYVSLGQDDPDFDVDSIRFLTP